jgi:RNA polymerase sigma factor (TIGR02999 family)
MENKDEISELLTAWSAGDSRALEKLMPLVTSELRVMAHAQMRRENPNHTLQTTALVNEAYLKLTNQKKVDLQSRTHFFAVAAKVMRHVLIDYAKSRLRDKRGGKADHVELDDVAAFSPEKSSELLALDEALERLAAIDPLKSEIVEMRHFGGMSVEETAAALKIAPVTVMRHWSLAKAWLKREITNQ